MSIVCSICQDSLSERPQCLPETDELISVALACGHLLHKVCIQQWFQNGGANSLDRSHVDCPCCKKSSNLSNALRIYPTCEQDTDSSKSSEQLESDIKILEELEDTRQVMMQLSSDLTFESSAHDSLKLEHGKLQSELHELKEEMKETKVIYATLEESLKYKIHKLEKEINEARETIYEMSARDRRIHRQLTLLKKLQDENRRTYLAEKGVEEDLLNQLLLAMSNTNANPDGIGKDKESEVQRTSTPTTASAPVFESDDIFW